MASRWLKQNNIFFPEDTGTQKNLRWQTLLCFPAPHPWHAVGLTPISLWLSCLHRVIRAHAFPGFFQRSLHFLRKLSLSLKSLCYVRLFCPRDPSQAPTMGEQDILIFHSLQDQISRTQFLEKFYFLAKYLANVKTTVTVSQCIWKPFCTFTIFFNKSRQYS